MRLSLLALPFAAALVRAGHYQDIPHKIKESIEGPPHGWLRHSPAPPDHLLELKIALPQPHFSTLEKHLLEVSNPKHERYGAYLSKEETEALMAPHPETLDAVSEWLSSHGIEEDHLYRSSAQDWVTTRVPVGLAEEMLNTVIIIILYRQYTQTEESRNITSILTRTVVRAS
jgi:tripeptidyl-peptidase-1